MVKFDGIYAENTLFTKRHYVFNIKVILRDLSVSLVKHTL